MTRVGSGSMFNACPEEILTHWKLAQAVAGAAEGARI
jgi:hypothetical protein